MLRQNVATKNKREHYYYGRKCMESRFMEGECIDLSAVQGYYPPRLQFDVRLKNNTGHIWVVFGYGGLLRATKEKIYVGAIDTVFERFDIAPNEEHRILPKIELDYKKLGLIEEKRTGDLYLQLRIDLLGVNLHPRADGFEMLKEGMLRGLQVDSFWVRSPGYSQIIVPQSKWVRVLDGLGYGKFKIVELLIPSFPSGVLDDAIESFEKAKVKLNEGDYVKVLMHCQDVIDKIVKATKPVRVKLEQCLGKDKFERIGKFKGALESFLGLRHEVALEREPVLRKDAELALHTTLAFLNYFAKTLAKLKEK